MANIRSAFANILSPSVTVVEGTAGFRVPEINSHSTLYMIGSGSDGPYLDPTLCVSEADFRNQFGGSLSENSVKLLFRNDPEANFYFIRAGISAQSTVTVNTTDDPNYTLTVNGQSVDYETQPGDVAGDITQGLITAINTSNAGATVTATTGASSSDLVIRPDTSIGELEVIVTAGDITIADTTPSQVTASDYVSAIENSFDSDDEWPQGFIFSPEAFQNLEDSTDRLAVGSALEALANDGAYDWKALIDCGPEYSSVAVVKEDGERYVSPQGHIDFLAPYVIDLDQNVVPASAGVAATATRMYKQRGYHQPYAGASYPLQGVVDVDRRFGRQEQDILNPLGINLIRFLKNKGVVIWGMRTRSSDPYYRFSTTRVIFNVLNGTLRSAFDSDLFTSIDGQGVLLMRIEETAMSVCRRMWQAGAFFGSTPAEAFAVKCSFENNLADDLEAGQVLLEVYAAPAPNMEKLLIGTFRTNIGSVQSAAAAGQVPTA